MRSARRLTFFAGAGVMTATCAIGLLPLPDDYRTITSVLPEVLAAVSWVLALRFRRTRLAVAATVIAFTNVVLNHQLSADGSGTWSRPEVVLLALALPLNLGTLAFLRDRGVAQVGSIVHLALILVQPLLAWGFLSLVAAAPAPLGIWEVMRTPQVPLLAFLIAVVFTLIALALRQGAFEGSLLWALLACGLAFLILFKLDRTDQSGSSLLDPAQISLLLAAAQIALLMGLVEDSYRLAFHDELTGLPSRRALNDTMRTLRGGFALAMVDVDKFKRFNDRYGHDAGDQALKMVADELARVSGGGRAFRYGGEEFSIVFTGKTPAEAQEPLEEVRTAIEGKRFAIRAADRPRRKPKTSGKRVNDIQHVTITVSMGLAGPTSGRLTPDAVLKAADKALYKAKKTGRNRLVVA